MLQVLAGFIEKISPRFGFPLVLSAAAWFGFCYVFLSSILYDQMIRPDVEQYSYRIELYSQYMNRSRSHANEFARCIYAKFFDDVRFDFSLWLATGKIYRPGSLVNIENSVDKIVRANRCGVPPWNLHG